MGKIKRFNRHQNMKEVTRTVILMLTRESTIRDNDNLTNMLYGLFDGYDEDHVHFIGPGGSNRGLVAGDETFKLA